MQAGNKKEENAETRKKQKGLYIRHFYIISVFLF